MHRLAPTGIHTKNRNKTRLRLIVAFGAIKRLADLHKIVGRFHVALVIEFEDPRDRDVFLVFLMRSARKIRQRAKRQNVAWVTLHHPAAKLDRPLAFSKLRTACAREKWRTSINSGSTASSCANNALASGMRPS